MRSSVARRLVKLRWAKEGSIDRLYDEEPWMVLPGEHEYRLLCKHLWGRTIHLPGVGTGLNQLMLLCYAQLIEDEEARRESKELVDLIVKCTLHNAMVNAAADSKEGVEAGAISPQDMDGLMTLLWQVQKITNPLAARPQNYASDKMNEEFEKNKELFNVPWKIKHD